jgi:hypothetical protein
VIIFALLYDTTLVSIGSLTLAILLFSDHHFNAGSGFGHLGSRLQMKQRIETSVITSGFGSGGSVGAATLVHDVPFDHANVAGGSSRPVKVASSEKVTLTVCASMTDPLAAGRP